MTSADAVTQEPPQEPPEEGGGSLRWFAVHTYSGYENRVKTTVEHKAQLEGLGDKIQRVVIPTEAVVEIKGGKKRTTQRNLMPGYVLVEIAPEEEIFNLIKSVKGVSSFVGDGHEPVPLTAEEVTNLLDIMESKHEKPKPKISYRKGDQVKVVEGPFANFIGNVDYLDEDKGKLRVMVSIFGRPTPVELDILQVEPT